jgi:hypothetical protein
MYPHLINKINNRQSKFQRVLIGFWCFNFQNQPQYQKTQCQIAAKKAEDAEDLDDLETVA